MDVVYGIEVTDKHDHYIAVAERALQIFAQAASPGAFLVDLLPARMSTKLSRISFHASCLFSSVRYVPEWFPGAGFQRLATESRKLTDQMVHGPIQEIERNIVRDLQHQMQGLIS